MPNGPYLSPILFPGATITGVIGEQRLGHIHGGIDIAAPAGTPIYAPVDLTVTRAGWSDSYGNVVYGVDQSGNQYRFAHMNEIGVAQGAQIAQGTVLGGVGSTGRSSGNHLHFEVRDKAGRVLGGLANDIVGGLKGKAADALRKGVDSLLKSNPVTAPFAMGASFLGLNPFDDSCGIICQIKKWFTETDFFKRAAFVVLGMILIVGAIVFFAKGTEGKMITKSLGKFAGS